jgi:Fe-S-cluster-containing dehydrogenase component
MKLGLLIDLDTCVGCHACATACKQWNGASAISGPLADTDAYGAEPSGTWFNRIRHYEVGTYPANKTVNFPMSCLHCEEAACVTVCPTGASYKREDGIVLVDQDRCMGCNLCTWACPYGAREQDALSGTVKKCTLCVDRVHDARLPEEERQPACVLACPTHARYYGDFDDPASEVSKLSAERGGFGLLESLGYKPVNRYLPPRAPAQVPARAPTPAAPGGALGKLAALARAALGRD